MAYQEPETHAQESVSIAQTHGESALTISSLRFEYDRDALGIGTPSPHLSWTIATKAKDWHQAAYAIEAYDAAGHLQEQTGRVASDQSVQVAWPFAALRSRERLALHVRVWGTDGSASAWSNLTTVEAGLLHPDDWHAQFITPD